MSEVMMSTHVCKASAGATAKVLRDLAELLEDEPERILIGLWNALGEDPEEFGFQVVWDIASSAQVQAGTP